jgi:hypothetical protein
MECLVATFPIPVDFLAWFEETHVPDMDAQDTMMLLISRLNTRVSRVCAEARKALYGAARSDMSWAPEHYFALLLEARTAADEAAYLNDTYFAPMTPVSCRTSHLRNLFHATRCKVHNSMNRLIDHFLEHKLGDLDPSLLQEWRRDSIQVIRSTVTLILENTLAVLCPEANSGQSSTAQMTTCWGTAARLLWPLTVTCWVPTTLPSQRQLARALMRRLAEDYGIRQALLECKNYHFPDAPAYMMPMALEEPMRLPSFFGGDEEA